MPDIAVSVADYLSHNALYTAAESPSAIAWNERAVESETVSPLWDKADADTEAARQAAFLEGPLVIDIVTIAGARRDLMLRPVTVEGLELGYSGGVDVFVIGYNERADGQTDLTVLRKLT